VPPEQVARLTGLIQIANAISLAALKEVHDALKTDMTTGEWRA
jgi:hypothetical protein